MLANIFRFTAQNLTGQTLAANSVKVIGRRWKFDSSGEVVYELTDTEFFNNSSTISNSTFSNGPTINNSSLYIGGDFVLQLTTPSGVNGDLVLYYDRSTDGGTTWTTDWHGTFLIGILATTSDTRRKAFSI